MAKAKQIFYAKRQIYNDQNHHKLSNLFWKTQQTTNAQITQIFKFRSIEYMKNLFWPQSFLILIAHCAKVITKTHGHIYCHYSIISASKAFELRPLKMKICPARVRPYIVYIQGATQEQSSPFLHPPNLAVHILPPFQNKSYVWT